jgi:hypothetical protein
MIVRFEVLTAMKTTTFCVMVSCRFESRHLYFGQTLFRSSGLQLSIVGHVAMCGGSSLCFSETLLSSRRHNPEEDHLS